MYQPLGQFLQISQGALLNAGLLRGGVINAQEIILAGGTNGVIRSQNYSPVDELGWAIYGDGSAFFYGDVFFGDNAIFLGDMYSSVWDGTIPANLATVDAGATTGYYLDSSAGAAQFMGDVFVGGTLNLLNLGVLVAGDVVDGPGVRLFGTGLAPGIDLLPGGDTATSEAELFATHDEPSFDRAYLVIRGPDSAAGGQAQIQLVTQESPDRRYVQITGPLWLSTGDVSEPTLTFGADPDTGLYSAGTNQLGVGVGGQLGWLFQEGSPSAGDTRMIFWTNSSRAYIFETDDSDFDAMKFYVVNSSGTANLLYTLVDTAQMRFVNGSASAPPVTFQDTDSGFYLQGDGNPAVTVAGSRVFDWTNVGARISDGSASLAGLAFISDTNTGIHHPGADIFGITAGGVEQVRIINGGAASSFYLERRLSDVGNHETLRLDRDTTAGLNAVGYFSSWEFDRDTGERRKDDILSLADSPRWDRDWFQKIRPVDFRRVSTGEREFGFILDEWKATDDNMKYLTTKGDSWGYSPHDTAVLAASVLEIQDHEQRLRALEAKLGA